MTRFHPNRRQFGLGLGAAMALVPFSRAFAQETRTITNWRGTYDIPANPQRIIAIDQRIDLETALVLEIPLLAYSDREVQPWVPADPDMLKISTPPNMEEILGLEPDLFICSDWGELDNWPIGRLSEIAPVLPLTNDLDWRENLANIGEWLGIEGRARDAVAQYDAVVAEVARRHQALLDTTKVALLYYFPDDDQVFIRGYDSAQERVLRDIGGHTLGADEFEIGYASMENLPDLLADVDAIIYSDFSGDDSYAQLLAHPLWPRVPAAAAGKVHHSMGNTNFGGAYTAMQIAREWDAAYSLLS